MDFDAGGANPPQKKIMRKNQINLSFLYPRFWSRSFQKTLLDVKRLTNNLIIDESESRSKGIFRPCVMPTLLVWRNHDRLIRLQTNDQISGQVPRPSPPFLSAKLPKDIVSLPKPQTEGDHWPLLLYYTCCFKWISSYMHTHVIIHPVTISFKSFEMATKRTSVSRFEAKSRRPDWGVHRTEEGWQEPE